MRRIVFLAAAVGMTCVLGTNLQAEDPAGEAEGVLVTDGGVSLSEVQPTPEMWFYVQERRRHDDPRTAVRRKAEYRAQQRQQRIAAMKAFGESKQRPRVEHSVFYSLFTTRNDGGWPVIWPMGVIGHYQSGRVPGDSGSP